MSLSMLAVRISALTAAVILLGMTEPTPRPSASPTPKPATPCMDDVSVDMVSKVESNNAVPGQVFRFKVKEDTVVSSGRFAAGTLGFGVVRSVSKAGRNNQYGFVALEPRYLVLRGGRRQDVSMDPHMPAVFTTKTPNLEKVAGRIPNPVPGLMMTGINYLRFGKDVTIGPGFSFYVVPIGDLTKNGSC